MHRVSLLRVRTRSRDPANGSTNVHYRRTAIEIESPEQLGYSVIKNNLAESSFSDMRLADYDIEADVGQLVLPYADHRGSERLRMRITDAGQRALVGPRK